MELREIYFTYIFNRALNIVQHFFYNVYCLELIAYAELEGVQIHYKNKTSFLNRKSVGEVSNRRFFS